MNAADHQGLLHELGMGKFGVVADDFTGAGDTGLQFHLAGRPTWILPRIPDRLASDDGAGIQAIALSTGSRHLEPAEARERVARAVAVLRSLGCTQLYKKVDSTLRGHLAVEIEEMRAAAGYPMAVLAPAFPEAGRITVGGYQLVDGLPVSCSSFAEDPLAPVGESHLPTLLEEPGAPVGHITLGRVMGGWHEVAGALAAFRNAGIRMVVADAARSEDLLAIARAIMHSPWPVLPAGSAGLARAIADECAVSRRVRPLEQVPAVVRGRYLGKTPPVLVVSGSSHPATLRQIGHVEGRSRILRADVRQLLLTDRQELELLARQALQGLLAGMDVVLTTVLSAAEVGEAQTLGRALGMTPWQIGMHLGDRLGALVGRLVEQAELSGLVLAGGETASAICAALPLEALQIVGEILPAMPLAIAAGLGGGEGLRLVTKSGGFGQADALARILDSLHDPSLAMTSLE